MDFTFPIWVSISVVKRDFLTPIFSVYGQKLLFWLWKGSESGSRSETVSNMDFTFPALVSISVVRRDFSSAIFNFNAQNFLFLVMKGIGIGLAQRDRVNYGFYISCLGLNFCSEAKLFAVHF